jgi:hypothetical protein
MGLPGWQGSVLKQSFMQVREIPVGVTGGYDSFGHLHNVDCIPGQILEREISTHQPRSAFSTDGHYKRAVIFDCRSGLTGDQLRRFRGSRASILNEPDLRLASAASAPFKVTC